MKHLQRTTFTLLLFYCSIATLLGQPNSALVYKKPILFWWDDNYIDEFVIDSKGFIYYISHYIDSRIFKGTPDGKGSLLLKVLPSYRESQSYPRNLAIDGNDNLYFTVSSSMLFKLSVSGDTTVLLGQNINKQWNVGEQPKFNLSYGGIYSIFIDKDDDIYLLTSTGLVKITQEGQGKIIAVSDSLNLLYENGSRANIAVDLTGNTFIADRENDLVIKVSPSGIVTRIAGKNNLSNRDGPGFQAGVSNAEDICLDKNGNIYVMTNGPSYAYKQIRKIDKNNNVSTIFNRAEIDAIKFDGYGNIYYVQAYTGAGDEIRVMRDTSFVLNATNTIKGKAKRTSSPSCIVENNLKGIPNQLMMATPGPFYSSTDSTGGYSFAVDNGHFKISQIIPSSTNTLIKQVCPENNAPYNLSLLNANIDTIGIDFFNKVVDCHFLKIDVSSARRRRCMRSSTTINYSNEGNSPVQNVEIKVIYPQYILPISSSLVPSSQNDQTLTFKFNKLEGGESGQIIITDSVVCGDESIRGMVQCVKAFITPRNNCFPSTLDWDGAELNVTGTCNDGISKVFITNEGADMKDSTAVKIFFSDTLVYNEKIKIGSNKNTSIYIPKTNSFVRIEVDQTLGNPYKKREVFLPECNGQNAAKTYYNHLPLDDEDVTTSINCLEIRDSYDPNDKLAFPLGWGTTHNINKNTQLTYTIRFQNTGNDTAYTVKIIDTLDRNFDLSTLEVISASHPYKYELYGLGLPTLKFTFNNIMLPDSSTNNLASNGNVTFMIKPKETIIETAVLKNKANIYFDFNKPVATNEVFHTIKNNTPVNLKSRTGIRRDDIILSVLDRASSKGNVIELSPVPSKDVINIKAVGTDFSGTLNISDVLGRTRRSIDIRLEKTEIKKDDLEAGVYFFNVFSNGVFKQAGRLIFE